MFRCFVRLFQRTGEPTSCDVGLEGSGSNRRIRAAEPNDDVEAGYGRTVVVIVVAVRVRDDK